MTKYLPAALAAICFAVAPNLIRKALSDGFSPMAGSLIAMSLALPVYTVIILTQQRQALLEGVDWRHTAFAVGAGLLTSSASLFYYLALSHLRVSAVVAINSSTLVFNLFLAWWLLREHITWQVMIGTALVGMGIILVVF